MLSFNLSAIDVILAISIVVLAVLYLRKFQEYYPEKLSYNAIKKDVKKQRASDLENSFSKNLIDRNGFDRLNDEDFSLEEAS